MAFVRDFIGRHRAATALLAGVAAAVLVPASATLALGGEFAPAAIAVDGDANASFQTFTPAGVDPRLARQAEETLREKGLRFTPADMAGARERSLTVAIRMDNDVARAITVRRGVQAVSADAGRLAQVAIAPTRYDLGIARGYQSFAQTTPKTVSLGNAVRDVPMADLSEFKPEDPRGRKPSRFSSRVEVETANVLAGTNRPLEALGDQTVDVSGSYRVMKNLDVTAGVRVTQDRDRLAPLTDADADTQAVYVGTQFRF